MKTSFEELLRRGEVIYYTNVGDSMMPLLHQGKDILVIKPIKEKLKRGDVVLYKRDSGQYVLHRIVKVRKHDYLLRGDNRFFVEYGVLDRHILGIFTGRIRDGVMLSIDDKEYRSYCLKMRITYPFRYLINLKNRLRNKIYRKKKL